MYEKLRTAIDSGLFKRSLTEVVPPPSAEDIRMRASSLPLPLHPDHVQLLLEWGGSNQFLGFGCLLPIYWLGLRHSEPEGHTESHRSIFQPVANDLEWITSLSSSFGVSL